MLTTRAFWQATLERAVKTFAQTLVALWGAGTFDVLHVDWQAGLGVAAGASLLSVLTSLGSIGIGNAGPGLGNAESLTVAAVPAQPETTTTGVCDAAERREAKKAAAPKPTRKRSAPKAP